jgi:photosystem II stability/assembly factor-like uncharacterized protein
MKKLFLLLIIECVFVNCLRSQWNFTLAVQTSTIGPESGFGYGINSVSAPKPSIMWASTFDTSGVHYSSRFFKTINNGTSWTTYTIATLSGMDLASISAVNKDTAWAAVNHHGGGVSVPIFYSKIYRTNDGGITWFSQNTATFTGPANHINFINFSDENNGICVGDSNTGYWEIYKTSNGGANWNRISATNIISNITNEKGVENCFDILNNNIWFGTTKGRVYKSIDYGTTWNVYNTGLSNISNISMKDSLNGLASNGLNIIKTSDGGQTWSVQTYSGNFHSYDFCFGQNGSGLCFSSGWKNGDMGSSYSTDGGLNWITLDSMPHTALDFKSPTGWSGGVTLFGGTALTHMIFYDWQQNNTAILSNTKSKSSISIFPNPFQNQLNLQLENVLNSKDFKIEMYNTLGILVQKWDYQFENKYDLTNILAGTYIIKLFNKGEYIESYRVIKE